MQEFEFVMLYKDGGPYQRKGGTFKTAEAHNPEEFAAMLADGWYRHPDFIGSTQDQQAPIDTTSPPTRAELEIKARELGLKFDGRTSDKKLGDLITAAIQGQPS